MHWRLSRFSTTSPVEILLDKDGFTLEELLDEDELMQECKSLNTRLINFLRKKPQIRQLLKYVVEEPPAGSDEKKILKFPFMATEIFTLEIEVIMKSIVEDEELMALLFSFLTSDHLHKAMFAGYFSKVVICLLRRKSAALMRYLQGQQEILKGLVDLVSDSSIMEVLKHLLGAGDAIHSFNRDTRDWLAATNLLEMLVDKLSYHNSLEVQTNAADILLAVSRLSHMELAKKLSSPSLIARIFHCALEDHDSRSTLVNSLSVCISLLDPKSPSTNEVGKGQQISDTTLSVVKMETIEAMLQRLGDLLNILNVEADTNILQTTYGKLCPPLGTHRIKVIEFLAVLLKTNNDRAREEVVRLGAIQQTLKLFFDYPFNNFLHCHVEKIITSCIESNCKELVNHLLLDCDFVTRLLAVFRNPSLSPNENKLTMFTYGKVPPKVGNMGHLVMIANRLVQASSINLEIQAHLQANPDWLQWQVSLQRLNSTEDVYQWSCGYPSAINERHVYCDEDDYQRRDYISKLTSSLTYEVFPYKILGNGSEGHGLFKSEKYGDLLMESDHKRMIQNHWLD